MDRGAFGPSAGEWLEPRSPAYRRISAAMFLVGFATFSLIYCVQPVLPQLAQAFGVSPAQSALALSLTTGCLAVAILIGGAAAEVLGRRVVMFASMCGAALLNIVESQLSGWDALLAARALEGLVLGGVPAVAIAYLAEEIHPRGLGWSMGLYVGGTAFGGMIGRVGMGVLTQLTSWRGGLGIIGAVDLLAALAFLLMAPASRHFERQARWHPAWHLAAWRAHLRDACLPRLFAIGFLIMGAFVALYNYLTFRLVGPPYQLTPTQLSLIFTLYLLGTAASAAAGALSDRIGRESVLLSGIALFMAGTLLTLLRPLAWVITGIAIVTIGFFIAHSVASGWVGQRAHHAKGHAASLYLLSYYIGSSVLGLAGGWFWLAGAWPAVVGFAGSVVLAAGVTALWLPRALRRAPQPEPAPSRAGTET